jgi:4-amino-4-deoxy-L-arabinose transferase-like glycosyltransferase
MTFVRRWAPRATGVALAVLTFVLVVQNQHDIGVARDETVYMGAGTKYWSWWSSPALNEASITAHFGGRGATDNNREHPPLVKTLMGASEKTFHDGLDWTDEITAYRLPQAALAALLVGLVFAMTLVLWGWAEATVAGLLVLFLPRAFFHAGLGCFDAPITTLWFATIYAYWRALASRRWSWIAGVIFGLALATKHNALLLPFAIGLHYTWVAYRPFRLERNAAVARLVKTTRWQRKVAWTIETGRAIGHGWWKTRPSIILAFAVIGPLTLYAVWPWLWFDPIAHVKDWIGFHTDHVHYNFEYLGDNWNAPPFPWHVALITTLFTVPVVTLAAGAIGTGVLIARARRGETLDGDRAPGTLLFLSAGASMGPFILLGSTPIFGAEKHWAPAIPSLCIAAGVGAVWAARALVDGAAELSQRVRTFSAPLRVIAVVVVGTTVVTAAAVETFHAQPYALTHYNALAGGAPGGADLGMNRQFWGYSARGVLPYLQKNAPTVSQPIYTHDASMAWPLYQRLGLAPKTLPDAGHELGGIQRSQWALVVHEKHFNRHDYMIWNAYGTVQPVFVLRFDGVPIVSVYRKPSPAERPP